MISIYTELIEHWAKERNLHTADPAKQMLKLAEEFGELAQGMAKNKPDQISDSIGDMYVVMTILSMQLGLNIGDCIKDAYDEKIFGCNWLFRRNDGWLYGYQYKPSLSSNQNIIFPEVIANPVPGDKSILIKETDNMLSFVTKNKLMHISELIIKEDKA